MKKVLSALLATFSILANAQEVTGAGATFPAPIYAKWAADYNKATGVKVNYQSVGSGAGIKQIEAKTVTFGASDMPLTDEKLKDSGLFQFPTVIGGVVPVINVKGIKGQHVFCFTDFKGGLLGCVSKTEIAEGIALIENGYSK